MKLHVYITMLTSCPPSSPGLTNPPCYSAGSLSHTFSLGFLELRRFFPVSDSIKLAPGPTAIRRYSAKVVPKGAQRNSLRKPQVTAASPTFGSKAAVEILDQLNLQKMQDNKDNQKTYKDLSHKPAPFLWWDTTSQIWQIRKFYHRVLHSL